MVLLIAFLLPFLFFLIYGLPILKKEGLQSVFNTTFFPSVNLPPKAPGEAFLQTRFTYYKSLSPKGSRKFFKRFCYILNNKEITGAEGFSVTDEMRYYIAACWVQITFGLDRYKMPNYELIKLYESTFYSRKADAEVKGLTTATVLFFSWADFLDGYENTTDNYNVGIHEFSHAFLISTFKNGDFDVGFSSYIDQWFEATKVEFENLSEGIPSHLRGYAAVNNYEFFSVCMENFFETPQVLKEKLPDIFYHLCYLLNQNPLNTSGDYAFEPNTGVGVSIAIPLPAKAALTLKYTGYHWSYFIPIASSLCLLLSFKAYRDTMITFPEFLLMFLSGLSIVAIKPIRTRLYNFFSPSLASLFIVTCFGFGVLNIICLGNYYIPISNTKIDEYEIVGYTYGVRLADNPSNRAVPVAIYTGRSKRIPETTFDLKDDALGNFHYLRSKDGSYTFDVNEKHILRINYHYGLFGLKVVESTILLRVE